MNNNNYIKAYKRSENSANLSKSPHEIVRTLMFQLVNCMEKIVIDIDDVNSKVKDYTQTKLSKDIVVSNKSKNLTNALSIIYGLQTSLDFDKAPEIAGNLFQLYEFSRQSIITGFRQNISDTITKAIQVMKEILDGWQQIPLDQRKL